MASDTTSWVLKYYKFHSGNKMGLSFLEGDWGGFGVGLGGFGVWVGLTMFRRA